MSKKINFPRITSIAFDSFDLYSNEQNPRVSVNRNVFCLIGANGLGKSTFLNTVNYAITGAVPDPNRTFQSPQDYYVNATRRDRTEDYYNGRISEISRPLVAATVELTWPSKSITVTRELFGSVGISKITFREMPATEGKPPEIVEEGDLEERFQDEVLSLTGLEDFAQFVFLIHFLGTFDEGRHLLMWDDNALTNALYLAFGTDPAAAKTVDKLKRDMDRESSRGRNVRFSARHVAERMKQLNEALQGADDPDYVSEAQLKAEYEALTTRRDEAEERLRRKQAEMRDADLKWTDLSAAVTEAQLEYRKIFSSRLQKGTSVAHHPIIRASLSEDRCAVCGTIHVGAVIQARISEGICPMCESAVETTPNDDGAIAELQRLDRMISELRDGLAKALQTRERVSAEVNAALQTEDACNFAVRSFEEKEAASLSKLGVGSDFAVIKDQLAKLEAERQAFLDQSTEHYRKRDVIRDKLRAYEGQLQGQYAEGSQIFVPRFRELAEAFIGRPIDVELEHRQGANDSGFKLKLRMDDQLRPVPDTVSESQRFFIDIALRMAILEYMASGPATLFIDTPEGSLDIAYEARAGSMFSKFVRNNNALMMTANLRSSELIRRLASLEKRAGMQIVRMTDWTDLSQVQQSEESLFVEAYDAIEAALN
ncbi:AAA family ATPase [Rhizobium rhizogenes]|uniref:AAA family ATPase n=1 Tax=Rhizobium rhizogenes TaxID=359 RepID=UPI001297EF16|nr:AAA family ATPase [Rhizobium rhizogenes]MQB35121.1 hypothetical protein [Rhizobium rhizogenes]